MRLIYAGSPEFSVPALQALAEAGHDIAAVYTQPDRRAGRGRHLTANPVKQAALELDLPVRQPETLRDEAALTELAAWQADAMIVAAYGLILPPAALDAPRFGCINIHASLLPRWRGAAPIQRAIEAGDERTGITIMQMDVGLDTGAMLAVSDCRIDSDSTAASLHDSLAKLGAAALLEVLADLPAHQAAAVAQDDAQANYASKLSKQEGRIDWSQDAAKVERQIRAFNPWPVASTMLNGEPLRLWSATVVNETATAPAGTVLAADADGIHVACGSEALLLKEVQPAGKRAMAAADFARSRELTGTRLG